MGQGTATWLAWGLLHLAVGVLGTAAAIRYALHRRLLDQPGERRSHSTATPRGGGISIVIALLGAGAWLGCAYPGQRGLLLAFMTGLFLVAAIGWWDDHQPLSPWRRLAVHAIAAAVLAAGALASGAAAWQAGMAFMLAICLTNIWNFMDGIDGLAASQAAIAGAGFALVLPSPWNWLALALVASSLGFMRFNFPKAAIFLGDVGSGALGYAVAALLTAGMIAAPAALPWLLLPVSAFVVDAGFTLKWRILNGERWWTAHVQHVYQRWAKNQSHVKITLFYALFSLLATGLMLNGLLTGARQGIWLAGIWYLLAAIIWNWAHRKHRS